MRFYTQNITEKTTLKLTINTQKTMNTTYEITNDLTASLTDQNYCLTVCSEKLNDNDIYHLDDDGEWNLAHDSLSNKYLDACNVWSRPEFLLWANEIKALANFDHETPQEMGWVDSQGRP